MKKMGLFICTLICANVLMAQTRFTIGSIIYEVIDSNEVKVYSYFGSDSVLVIPDTVTNQGVSYAVTEIGWIAFQSSDSLISVTIPNSVTLIHDDAFYYCTNLASVTIPNSVTSIGNSAFANCSSLDSIIIPNSVISIGNSAFYGCSSLNSIIISNSVTSIENSTFYGCSSLDTIVIPNSVTSIGNRAFYGCSSLDTIVIPNSVTTLGLSIFCSCSSLTSITLPDSVSYIGYSIFQNCYSLTSVTLPNNIDTIVDNMFCNCSSLTSINIPNTIVSIGKSAFEGCSNLTSITIPNTVTHIKKRTFWGCSSLTSITIPNTVTTIEESAFRQSGLVTITIPNSVTHIEKSVFQDCINLMTASFPDSIAIINQTMFSGCSSLSSFTIPCNVTNIGSSVFVSCTNLQEIISLPHTPPLLGYGCFNHIPNTAVLKVPCHTDEYASSNWGNYFDSIQKIEGSGYYAWVNSNNSDWGYVEVEGNCTDTITITATANDCYQFLSWNDGSTDNPRNILLSQDTSFTATFDLINSDRDIYDTICEGETYTDNDFYAIQTGVYTRRLISSTGCDSITTLHLTVNQHTTGIDTVEACNSYTWIDGITYAQSTNRPTYTLTNSGGCDSIVTLNLTILECIYNVTVNVFNNDTTGTVIGSGQYMHGDTATIMALANNGFHFVQWKDGSVENPRKVVVTSDTTFSAIFGANPHVAINDSEQLESLTLHPNPTTGIITFNRTDICKVEVLDAMGRLLMTIENKHIIDLSKLSQGYYTLRITLPEDTIVRKVIKQ